MSAAMNRTIAGIPYADLARDTKGLREALMHAVDRVLSSGVYVQGEEISAFEEEFAAFCGTRFAVGVANGTDALILALRALDIGAGDEVITVANSFLASVSCIALVGARPCFVDVGPDMNMDPACLAAAITARTRAILPVHLTGRAARMEEILDIAGQHGIPVIEDAAQAAGASRLGCRVGTFGRMAAFSLHPNKNLGAYGDAGIITTDDAHCHAFLLKARNHGLSQNRCEFWSVNSRLDPLQAAMLRVKLRHLEAVNSRRREVAARYRRGLEDVVRTPTDTSDELPVYHTFMILSPRRAELRRHLAHCGIESRIHYETCIHRQPAARGIMLPPAGLPVTEALAEQIVSLPIFNTITDAEVDAVITAVHEFPP